MKYDRICTKVETGYEIKFGIWSHKYLFWVRPVLSTNTKNSVDITV